MGFQRISSTGSAQSGVRSVTCITKTKVRFKVMNRQGSRPLTFPWQCLVIPADEIFDTETDTEVLEGGFGVVFEVVLMPGTVDDNVVEVQKVPCSPLDSLPPGLLTIIVMYLEVKLV